MIEEDRQEARAALIHAYNSMEKLGFDGIGMIAGYLEKNDGSYDAVKGYAKGNQGIVDKEDLLMELLTAYFEKNTVGAKPEIRETLTFVYNVLFKGGYNPIDQMSACLFWEDPSYITFKENARSIFGKIDRHDLMLELVTAYFK